MNEFFREKYSEIILQKQKSIGEYHLAINNLFTAFQKNPNQNEEADLFSKEFSKNMHNTIIELANLQRKKVGLTEDQTFHSQKNFSNILDVPHSPIIKQTQSDLTHSFEFLQNYSSNGDQKDIQNENRSLESQQKSSDRIVSIDTNNEFSQAQDSIQPPPSSISLNKVLTKKIHKKNNKKKPTLKVTLKNDAPPPPPWIPR